MSLKLKVSLILLTVFAALFAANAVVLRALLWPGFEALEMAEAQRDLDRVQAALQADVDGLSRTTEDWAVWDDAYRFAADRNGAFRRANLIPSVFTTLDLEVHYLYDTRGERIGGSARRPDSSGESIELPLLPVRLPADHFLRPLLNGETGSAGFLATEQGPLMLAVHPILTSSHGGPARGLMVMGRFITEARVAELAQRVQVPLEGLFNPTSAQASVPQLTDDHVEASLQVAPLSGPPPLTLRAAIPLRITDSGARLVNYTLAALIVTASVVLLVVLAVVQNFAVNPLARLAAHVRQLAETGNLHEQLSEQGEGEFGYLAREFNRMQWRVSRLAFYDALTDLPNRFMLTEHLNRAVSRAQRTGRALAVFYLDLDGFKAVNDRYGHAAGDALLRQVAQRFRANLRGYDIVARLGGDEFVVLIEDLPGDDRVPAIAEKILGLFTRPLEAGDERIMVTTSIGISLYPTHGTTPDELLLAADIAMYRAKQAGKNQYGIYSEWVDESAASR